MASEKDALAFGARIRDALAERPVTWLAKQSGVSRSTINAAIGGTFLSIDKAYRIAQALGTTVEYLMTGEGAPPAPLPGVAEPVMEFRQPSDAAIRSFAEKHKRAAQLFEEATQAVRVIPDEVLRMTLVRIIARYGVEIEDIADILTSKARKDT